MSLASQISLFATRAATEFKSVRTALGLKAPLASPVLTGTPTAPTPGTTTNNDVLATTAFVQAVAAGRMQYRGAWAASTVYALNDVITNGGVLYVVKTAFTSPATFTATNLTAIAQIDVSGFASATSVNARLQFRGAWVASTVYAVNDVITNAGVLYVVKTAFTSGTTFSATNLTSIGVTDLSLYAPLASPTFTGIPAAPTATAGTSTTQLATTEFVTTADGLRLRYRGDWTVGTAYALNDVVNNISVGASYVCTTAHTSPATFSTANWTPLGAWDTSFLAPLSSPIFTGDPTVPDPAASDNDRSIANTGWVQRLLGAPADWAAQLTAALTPPSQAGLATTGLVGATQLATTDEAAAGAIETKAVTPLGLVAALDAIGIHKKTTTALTVVSWRRYARITDPGDGNGAFVQLLLTGMGGPTTLDRAAGILRMTIRNDVVRARVQWLDGPPPVFFYTKRISATVYEIWGQPLPQRPHNVYLLDGNGVTFWGADSETTTQPTNTVQVTALESDWALGTGIVNWDVTFETSIRREPGGMFISLACKKASGAVWASGDVVLTLQTVLTPAGPQNGFQATVTAYSSSGAGWANGTVPLAINPAGQVVVNAAPANTHGLFGSFFVPINGA